VGQITKLNSILY